MKNILVLILLLAGIPLKAQNCNDNTHSTNSNDGWLSCTTDINPNPARGTTHWILYDLGAVYELTTTYFWNYNVFGQTDRGMKDIILDTSTDGVSWTAQVSFELSQATGNSSYTGNAGPNLNGISARYVLITVNSTWGHSCAGLAEVKFGVQPYACFSALTHPTLPVVETEIRHYESSDYIRSNTLVLPNAMTIYDAANCIELNAGFTVEQGAIFEAFIDGCNGGLGSAQAPNKHK